MAWQSIRSSRLNGLLKLSRQSTTTINHFNRNNACNLTQSSPVLVNNYNNNFQQVRHNSSSNAIEVKLSAFKDTVGANLESLTQFGTVFRDTSLVLASQDLLYQLHDYTGNLSYTKKFILLVYFLSLYLIAISLI